MQEAAIAFKLRELSDMFCALDGIDDRDKQIHHYSQMRLLAQRELIKPTTSDISRGKVARYSLENACVARILMTLHRSGEYDARVM